MIDNKRQLWDCKIGVKGQVEIPHGADFPMRRAVEAEFKKITGQNPDYIFSGWGSTLGESELAVVENRAPDMDKVYEPIDMVLFCPMCGVQHIDEPEAPKYEPFKYAVDENGTKYPIIPEVPAGPVWTNPPHRSHLCNECGCIWRPADVPTNGVLAIQTNGVADNFEMTRKLSRTTINDKYTRVRAALINMVGVPDEKGPLLALLGAVHRMNDASTDAKASLEALVVLLETHE
jgi:hypothetical protein